MLWPLHLIQQRLLCLLLALTIHCILRLLYSTLKLVSIVGLGRLSGVHAGMASPYPFRLEQGNGSMTPYLICHGGPDFHFMTDVNGYTITEDSKKMIVYAMMNETSGDLMPTSMMVGYDNPEDHGLTKQLVPREMLQEKYKGQDGKGDHDRRLAVSMAPILKNLVILIRFSDHKHRVLPTKSEVDILFNQVEGDPFIAPTGSVRDVFTVNSYGKFSLESDIYGWVDLRNTEKYYADGLSGYGTHRYFEALYEALDVLEGRVGFSFHDFDANGDGKVDMVTLLHSGYAAEVPGTDIAGATTADRIWSHRWALPRSRYWTSGSGMNVHQYSTSPSLWDKSGSLISRIGVISHEIGHCLGLPDLYGTWAGSGAGSYDLMSNHWGFAPYSLSQLFPPTMSPWTKIRAGWVEPIRITKSGTYSIQGSQDSDNVYRIDLGGLGTEYLLIENRQPIGFDFYVPQGGLAIWHIDEAAPDVEGYPGQDGYWPANGNHYINALLQADGRYDLEHGRNHGDKGDLFHAGGKNSLAPSEYLLDGPFPNTDTYQRGFVYKTDLLIYDISASAPTMKFSVKIVGGRTESPTAAPTKAPTSAPTASERVLGTTFAGGNGAAGVMFDIKPLRDITIHELELHTKEPGFTLVEVWIRSGTHVNFEKDPVEWQRLLATEIDAAGLDKRSPLDLGSLSLLAGETYGIFITLVSGGLRYTNGDGVGQVAAQNDDLIVYEGVGKASPFGYSFPKRIWNGNIHYSLTVRETSPTSSPTSRMPLGTQSLVSTFAGGTGQAGNMFDVQAKMDVSITSFDLHIAVEKMVQIEIYTKAATFIGSETECSKWNLIANISVFSSGLDVPTQLPMDSFEPVLVRRDCTQAFYITLLSRTGMRYSYGNGTRLPVAYDDYLAIFEGAGKGYSCGESNGATFWNRVWNGAIHYEPAAVGMSPAQPAQFIPGTTKKLEIEFVSEQESTGMFRLHAKKSISLTGMSFSTEESGLITVELFSFSFHGHSDNPDPNSWATLLSTQVIGRGPEQDTQIPVSVFTTATVVESKSRHFIIKITANETTFIDPVGTVRPFSNEDLIVSNPKSKNQIATSNNARVWKAIFDYLVIDR
jgi:M6 family metalloprotease-like protein